IITLVACDDAQIVYCARHAVPIAEFSHERQTLLVECGRAREVTGDAGNEREDVEAGRDATFVVQAAVDAKRLLPEQGRMLIVGLLVRQDTGSIESLRPRR